MAGASKAFHRSLAASQRLATAVAGELGNGRNFQKDVPTPKAFNKSLAVSQRGLVSALNWNPLTPTPILTFADSLWWVLLFTLAGGKLGKVRVRIPITVSLSFWVRDKA
jgi:hypothetical protein